MNNVLEEAQRMVDECIAKKKENRKNCGLRCRNCKTVIRYAKNDYLTKPYCITCLKAKGTYEFTQRADIYQEENGKWKKVKKLSQFNINEY